MYSGTHAGGCAPTAHWLRRNAAGPSATRRSRMPNVKASATEAASNADVANITRRGGRVRASDGIGRLARSGTGWSRFGASTGGPAAALLANVSTASAPTAND